MVRKITGRHHVQNLLDRLTGKSFLVFHLCRSFIISYATPTAVAVPLDAAAPTTSKTTTQPYAAQVPGAHKGPVVTKYAIPSHVAAQMKARGVHGTSTIAPTMPRSVYGSQYSGWQQWQGQTAQAPAQTMHQPQLGMQGSGSYVHPTPEHTPAQLLPSTTLVQAGLPASSLVEATSSQSSTVATTSHSPKGTDPPTITNEHLVTDQGKENDQGEDVVDDLTSLDIPDMPKSYGTPAYAPPKLVSKPVYAVAPEWTQSGYGEITICFDPNGRTESDYIKHGDTESVLNSVRTSAHDEDPIFATIDLDAPPVMDTRSESRDSGRSEFETPLTYDSGETRPTSIDEVDEDCVLDHRRKPGTPIYYKHKKHDETSPRGNSHDHHHRRYRKERRGSSNFHDKKRKHEREENRSSLPMEIEPQTKKSRTGADPVDDHAQDS